MSIATLKKRTKNTYKVLSGKSPTIGFNVNRTSSGNYGATFQATTYGGGFSINGPHRSRGRVGQSMAMSQNGIKHKGVFIPDSKGGKYLSAPVGYGGNNEKYYISTPITNCITCNLPTYSKPSVMNYRSLHTLKKEGILHNNWVQPDDNYSNHSQSNYIEHNLIPKIKNHYHNGCSNDNINCHDKNGKCKTKRINSKLVYPTTISKNLNTMTSEDYLIRRKKQHASLPTVKYDDSWPKAINSHNGTITGSGCMQPETYEDFLNKQSEIKSDLSIFYNCNNLANNSCNKNTSCSC